jgi:hypothetical protein
VKFLELFRKVRLPKCAICGTPVDIKSAKTDEKGKAVHEDCYAAMIRLRQVTPNN